METTEAKEMIELLVPYRFEVPKVPATPKAASEGMPMTSTDTEIIEVLIPYRFEAPQFPKNLPETDEIPLETPWHRAEINLLIESLDCHWPQRKDFFAGGNMFVYYCEKQVRNRSYRGPDFFYVDGVERDRPREYWAIWDEGGKYPDTIIELLSKTTAVEDRTTKKEIYDRIFRTREYYCYDPDDRFLEGWRLNSTKHYKEIIANEKAWLWSDQLNLWLGTWEGAYLGVKGTWLRFFDAQGQLVLNQAERAQQERQRAEQQCQRAEQERQRADALEAELTRLKTQRDGS